MNIWDEESRMDHGTQDVDFAFYLEFEGNTEWGKMRNWVLLGTRNAADEPFMELRVYSKLCKGIQVELRRPQMPEL